MQQMIYDNPDSYIQEKMKQFRLVDMREQYEDLIREATTECLGYKEFLIRLLKIEEEGKANKNCAFVIEFHNEVLDSYVIYVPFNYTIFQKNVYRKSGPQTAFFIMPEQLYDTLSFLF